MALADTDLQPMRRRFSAWLAEAERQRRPSRFDLQLLERLLRAEQGDKRFEQIDGLRK
ncbi:MAG: hypothetical protein GWP70_07360 [Proteobacteria bacterium]|nr:hypothetical protein [Pseudomonadota bacterium]